MTTRSTTIEGKARLATADTVAVQLSGDESELLDRAGLETRLAFYAAREEYRQAHENQAPVTEIPRGTYAITGLRPIGLDEREVF